MYTLFHITFSQTALAVNTKYLTHTCSVSHWWNVWWIKTFGWRLPQRNYSGCNTAWEAPSMRKMKEMIYIMYRIYMGLKIRMKYKWPSCKHCCWSKLELSSGQNLLEQNRSLGILGQILCNYTLDFDKYSLHFLWNYIKLPSWTCSCFCSRHDYCCWMLQNNYEHLQHQSKVCYRETTMRKLSACLYGSRCKEAADSRCLSGSRRRYIYLLGEKEKGGGAVKKRWIQMERE